MLVGDLEIRLRADIARLQRDMDDARRVVGGSIDGIKRAAEQAKAALAGMIGGLSIAALGGQLIGAQREFDKLNASLITATGSAAAAATTFKSLQAFAATTPYSVADATQAFVKMKNLGLDPSEKALRSYGNTAAAMGKGLDQMIEAVADAATGEFERLKEFGIKASQNGNQVALTFKGVTTSVGNNAEEIQTYLRKIGDTDFGGAMEMRAATLDGAISNLADSWDALLLSVSQSGFGAATAAGVSLLANNLQLLAGTVTTIAAAKLGSVAAGWAAETYKAVAASAALQAAKIAEAESEVASTSAKVAEMGVTQAMLVVARDEAAAKLVSSNANIAAARTAIAAAEAAGAQSFALRTVRLATAELAVAEAQRSAMLAELALLGRQQASVSAQTTAALAAQAAAQTALNGATAGGAVAAGMASRALGLLGGPVGAIITVLGLAATAWTVWGNSAKDANDKAAQSMDETAPQMLDRLNEEIKKLKERKALLEAKPEVKNANEKDLAGAARLKADLEAIKANAGEYAGQTDEMREMLIRIVTRQYNEAIADIEGKQRLQREIAIAGDTTMAAVRQRLTGVNQDYLDTLQKLSAAHEKGILKDDEYVAAVSKLAKDTFEGSAAGKLYAQSLDSQSSAIQRAAEAQGLLNQRQQEHVQFLKAGGQINDESAINSTAALQIQSLNDQIKAQEKLRGIAAKRQGSEKEQADITGRIANLNIQIDNAKAKRDEDLFALEQQRYRQAVGNSADVIEKEQAELASLRQQTQAQIDQNEQIGLSTKQIAELTAARLEEAAARKDAESITAEGLDLTGERAQRIRDEAAALRERAAAVIAGAAKQEMFDKNLQDLNAMVDIMSALDEAAQSAAQGMASAFGSVGQAIGGMTTALTGFERTQAAIAAQLAASLKDAHGDPTKIQRANQMAAEASAQAQIKSYGDMAGAAKGFFDEQSKGYAVLNGAEKAYRAAEMVMALESMTKKIFFKETEVAANVSLNAAKLTGEATASAASTGLAATEASAWGITAVVKAIASMPFPLNLAAGAATLAAVVGIGAKIVGSVGGGSMSLAQQRQEAQGAGSVLGDKDAKSESIKRALDQVAKNTYQDLAINSSMLATLRSIDTNISSFASQLVRSTDITNPKVALNTNNGFASTVGGAALGGMAGAGLTAFTTMGAVGGPIGMVIGAVAGAILSKIPAVGNLMTSIFGGRQSVEDSGFKMDAASLESILGSGVHAYQYADIKTSGGWFRSDKTSQTTNPLDDAANQQFTAIIKSLADGVKTAGSLLGLEGDDFTAKLNSFVVDIGEVSLKDLKGDDLQKAVESVFSKLGDQMAQYAVGGLQDLQQVGEGYLETLARVATEYQTIDVVFQSFGKTFGAVGLASAAARDRLVQLAGGLDKFTSQGEYFLTNFFSEQEQAAALKTRVQPVLDQYGLQASGEGAMRALRDFVVGLDTTTAAGAQAYATLMQYAPAVKQIADAEQKVYDERKDLQDQLDELTMTSAQLLAKQRDALDESNRALFDQVQELKSVKASASTLLSGVDSAYSVLEKVVGREKTAVQSTIDAHTEAASRLQSLSQTLHSALDSMTSSQQTAASRLRAQAEIRADLAITKAGGSLSDAQVDSLKKALSVVQQDASSQFSSYADYMRDLLQTQNDVAALAGLTDDSLSVEQKALAAAQDQLKSLDAILTNAQIQIDELKGQSTTLLSINDALGGLTTAILAAQANPIVSATSGINQAYQQMLGRAPDAAGLEYWQQVAAGGTSIDAITASIGNSAEAQVRKLYQDLLGRPADAGGLDYYLHTGASISAISDSIKQSDEYKKLHKIPGFAGGGDFGGGIRAVGEVGIEIEATGPSRIHSTQAIINALRNPSNANEALVAEVRALRDEVKQLREANSAENRAIAKGAQQTAEHLDAAINGDTPVATKVIEVTKVIDVKVIPA